VSGDDRSDRIPAGTDVNLASSPPVASAKAPSYAVGAHVGHVNPTAASALMGPIACRECHVVPSDSTHSNNPSAQPVVFGTLSRTGGAAPTWAAGTIKQGGGHLNGKADGGDCKSCHGEPPTTGKHNISDHRNRSCDACHPTGYTSTVAVAAFHQNGVTDLGTQAGYSCGLKACPTGTRGTCTNKCHGKESW